MNLKIDTITISNDCEVIDVIHGKGEGLYRTFTNHHLWETMLEDLQELKLEVKNMDELELALQSGDAEAFTYNIKIFKQVTYKY